MRQVNFNAPTVDVFLTHTSVTAIETAQTTAMKPTAPLVSMNIRYDETRLLCAQKLTGSQLSLPHYSTRILHNKLGGLQ